MLTTNAISVVGMVYNKISQVIADNSADAKTKTVDIMSRKLGIPRTTITRIIDGKVLITNDENIIGRLDDDEFCLKAIDLIQLYYDVDNDPDIKLVNVINHCGSIEEDTDAEYEADTAELMDITGLSRDTISDILALQQPMTFQRWIVSDMRNAIEDELDANFGKKVNSESYWLYDDYVKGICDDVLKWMNDKQGNDETENITEETTVNVGEDGPAQYKNIVMSISHYNDELLNNWSVLTPMGRQDIDQYYDRYMYQPISKVTGISAECIKDVVYVIDTYSELDDNDASEIVHTTEFKRIMQTVPVNRITFVCDEIDRVCLEVVTLKFSPDYVKPLNMVDDDDEDSLLFTESEKIDNPHFKIVEKIHEYYINTLHDLGVIPTLTKPVDSSKKEHEFGEGIDAELNGKLHTLMYKPISDETGIAEWNISSIVEHIDPLGDSMDDLTVGEALYVMKTDAYQNIKSTIPTENIDCACANIDLAYDKVNMLNRTDRIEITINSNFDKATSIITAMLQDIDKTKEIAKDFGYEYLPYGVRLVTLEIALTYRTTVDAVNYIATYCNINTLHDDLSIGFINKLLDGIDERKLTMPNDEDRRAMFGRIYDSLSPKFHNYRYRIAPQKVLSEKHALDLNPTQSQVYVVSPRFGSSKNEGTGRKLVVVDQTKNRGNVKPKVLKLCRKYETAVNATRDIGYKINCSGYSHYVPLAYQQGTVIIDHTLLSIIDSCIDCCQSDKIKTIMNLAQTKNHLQNNKFNTLTVDTNAMIDPYRIFLIIDLLLEKSYDKKVIKKVKKLVRRIRCNHTKR